MADKHNRRHTSSREDYWQKLFSRYTCHSEDHLVSGWSKKGWEQRMSAYFAALKNINLPKNALVLDLGCGSGSYTRILENRGYHTIALDYAWEVVAEAKKRSSRSGGEYLCGNINNLPFPDNTFDHVFCIGVFQSLMHYLGALFEIRRVLAIGAPLLVMSLNRLEITTLLKRILGKEEKIFINGKPAPRLKTYNPYFFRRQLLRIGFCDIELKPVQILPAFLIKFTKFMMIWNGLPFLPYLTARSFMVRAYKISY